jgi:ParB-like chromosome segregation protein Spo0J
MSLSQLTVTYAEIQNLVPYARNARTHSRRQIRQIADSIRTFGFTNPVLVNRSRMIIAGHGRVAAAKLLGIIQVPTICLDNLTEDEIRAYILADNKLAEKAGWDLGLRRVPAQELENRVTEKLLAFLKADAEVFDGLDLARERPEVASRLRFWRFLRLLLS